MLCTYPPGRKASHKDFVVQIWRTVVFKTKSKCDFVYDKLILKKEIQSNYKLWNYNSKDVSDK